MSKRSGWTIFRENIGSQNPVLVQTLGICSTLAVTNVVRNTVVMCLGLIFVTTLSNLLLSLMRAGIPSRIRMMVETLVIASLVIVVDIFLKAFHPDISRQLGPYVGLIITNCIIMGHAEAVALVSPPRVAALDGFSAGLGYALALLAVACVRELLGTGAIWGARLLGPGWVNWSIMVMAPGGFFVLALLIWAVKGNMRAEPCRGGG